MYVFVYVGYVKCRYGFIVTVDFAVSIFISIVNLFVFLVQRENNYFVIAGKMLGVWATLCSIDAVLVRWDLVH